MASSIRSSGMLSRRYSGISTAGITPQAPAVGAATIRRMQALDSPMHRASVITSAAKLPEMGSPEAA